MLSAPPAYPRGCSGPYHFAPCFSRAAVHVRSYLAFSPLRGTKKVEVKIDLFISYSLQHATEEAVVTFDCSAFTFRWHYIYFAHLLYRMGYKCSVAKCKSGYVSSTTTKKVSFFAFPRNDDLRKKWTRACHRERFEPTEHSRICSLHFEDNDFEIYSSDTVHSRRLKHPVLKQRKLKPSAVPRVHPNLPQRMQSLKNTPRSTTVTADARLEIQNERIEKLNDENLSRENCSNFTDFVTKVKTASLPSNYFTVFDENYVLFLLLSNVADNDSQPHVEASVKVSNCLDFVIFVGGFKVSNLKVQHLLKTKTAISSVIEVSNILAFVKSLAEKSPPTHTKDLRFLENFERNPDDSFLSFVMEQLKIRSAPKASRRFSPNLIIQAFIWHSLSPSLYRKLCDFFCLPSERRLQQLSCRNDVSLNNMEWSTLLLE